MRFKEAESCVDIGMCLTRSTMSTALPALLSDLQSTLLCNGEFAGCLG